MIDPKLFANVAAARKAHDDARKRTSDAGAAQAKAGEAYREADAELEAAVKAEIDASELA